MADSENGSARPPSTRRPRRSAGSVAGHAAEQLVQLTGKQFESIVGLHRDDEGWQVEVEVLELRRIPETTDVLATYQVEVDAAGDLVGYRRLSRYTRGDAGESR